MNTADNNLFDFALTLFNRNREKLSNHFRMCDSIAADDVDTLHPYDTQVLLDEELSVEVAVMFVRLASLAYPARSIRMEVSFDEPGNMNLIIYAR